MRPRLDDQAILEDVDHVAVDNGRQAVRNDDRGPTLQEFAQAVLDQALVERVEGRGFTETDEVDVSPARQLALGKSSLPRRNFRLDSLASSSTRMGGSLRIVRAIETRCFSPPLSLCPRSPRKHSSTSVNVLKRRCIAPTRTDDGLVLLRGEGMW